MLYLRSEHRHNRSPPYAFFQKKEGQDKEQKQKQNKEGQEEEEKKRGIEVVWLEEINWSIFN